MKALILTEGGQKIGFGHITRCRALADAMKKAGMTVTFVVNGDNSVRDFFRGQIDHLFDWLKEGARLGRLLGKTDAVIVDSYLAPRHFYERISDLPLLPVFLDDYLRIDYPHGVLVNGGIGAEKFRYRGPNRYPRLLGPAYALVRKEFWNVKSRTAKRKVKHALVTFGGIERGSFVVDFLRGIAGHFPQIRFHAVLSSRQGFERAIAMPNLRLYSGLSAARMCKLMFRCDLAICGGGQTTNELSRCGVPMLGIRFAANQTLNLNGWQRAGVLVSAGYWKDKDLIRKAMVLLAGFTYRKRYLMSRLGQKLVDGQGAERIAAAITDLQLRLDPAGRDDSRKIFTWANDRGTRSMSFNAERIRWNEHQKWFAAQLKRRGLDFSLACLGKEKIGSVRFQRERSRATVSLVVSPKFRGRGLGARLVRVASNRMFEISPIKRIDAFIKSKNDVSKKIFAKAGYGFLRAVRINDQPAEQWVMKKT